MLIYQLGEGCLVPLLFVLHESLSVYYRLFYLHAMTDFERL